jgi:hypothetical protein
MKAVLAISAALLAAPLAAAPAHTTLPGVSDEETTISHGGIREWERGHGDVLFVRDSADHWYRLQLNQGCLKGPMQLDQLVVENGNSTRIDRFTKIRIPKDLRLCGITSIRASVPPPQVDSKSPITLD